MWDKVKRLLCRCKEVELVQGHIYLEVRQCFKCEQYWLYNKNENHRIKITREEAQGLLEFWNEREVTPP
jgi:hypothetical protein